MPTKRFYWDSCVFIDRIARKPSVIAELEQITDAAAKGDVVIIASTLCIAECYKIKESSDSWTVQQKLINDFFDNPWIELNQVDSLTAELAQEIARSHGLKPPDAIHIATAIRRKADVMHSYDGSKSHSPLRYDGKIGEPPLAIKVPARLDPQLPLPLGHDEPEEQIDIDTGEVIVPPVGELMDGHDGDGKPLALNAPQPQLPHQKGTAESAKQEPPTAPHHPA